jgi:hypothetical protein
MRQETSSPQVRHDEVLWPRLAVHKGIGMGCSRAFDRALASLSALGLAAALTGCSTSADFQSEVHPHLKCVDDSPRCVAERQSTLKQMMSDRKHGWVHEPADANAYAAGVRMFAFKTRKRELDCKQLAIGRREADAGPGMLRGPGGKHLTPAQISRGVMFANEVSRELAGEMRRRCKS